MTLDQALILAAGIVAGWIAVVAAREMWLHCLVILIEMIFIPLYTQIIFYPQPGFDEAGALTLLYLFVVVATWLFLTRNSRPPRRGAALAAGGYPGARSTARRFQLPRIQWPAPPAPKRGKTRWIVAFAVVLAIDVALRWRYGMLLSGSVTAEALAATPYLATSILQFDILLSTALYCVIVSGRLTLLAKVAVAVFVVYGLVVFGRRALVLDILIPLILHTPGLFMTLPFRRLLPRAAAVAAVFLVVTPLFITARQVALNLVDTRARDSGSALSLGLSAALGGDSTAPGLLQSLANNLTDRGNPGTFLAKVIFNGGGELGGAITKNSLVRAIPTPFINNKPPMESEQVIETALGMPIADLGICTLAIGYADWGVLGVIAMGLIVACLAYAFFSVYRRETVPTLIRAAALSTFFFISFNVESDLENYGGMIRDFTILSLVTLLVVSPLPKARRDARPRGQQWVTVPLATGTLEGGRPR